MQDQAPRSRRVVQLRPGQLDLLQLPENLTTEVLDGALMEADLFWASLWDVNLRHAYLVRADLSYARLCNADLSYSDFVGAELPKDLTQEQLDPAVAAPDNPPILTDVKDRKTVNLWSGAALSD